MNREPDPRADGMSADDYCALLPQQRVCSESQGQLLFLPRQGLTVVPFRRDLNGWTVTVVEGDDFHRTGHNVRIGDAEICTAIELSAGEPVATRFVNTPEEAETLPVGGRILSRNGYVLCKELRGGEVWCVTGSGYSQPSGSLKDSHFPAKVLGAVGARDV